MIYNTSFTTYRRETSGDARQYSATPTITDGAASLSPTDGDLKAVLGIDFSVKSFNLLTEELDIKIGDRVVIDSEDYNVASLQTVQMGGLRVREAIIYFDPPA